MTPTPGDVGLLDPGRHRTEGITDDAAIVEAMLDVEVAWANAVAAAGVITQSQADTIAAAARTLQPDVLALAAEAESIGNAVLPVVTLLRAAIDDPDTRTAVHRGLTSQDVLDTALILITRDALGSISADLRSAASALAALADEHRGSVMAGRTLTQHAVPITFGLKAAGWLQGVLDALDAVTAVALPAQVGGAAGTLALAGKLTDDPVALAAALADELGLELPAAPWHTRRTPVTAAADAAVRVTDALGVIGANVALLTRPEFDELAEGGDRGGSSTMPHKHNPVLSVLLRSAALQAPMLAATVHVAAGQNVDERPDGAWHAEWAAYRRLLTLAVVAASQAAELLDGLVVDAAAMHARATANTDSLLAERYGAGNVPPAAEPAEYLGATETFIGAALARAASVGIVVEVAPEVDGRSGDTAQSGGYPPTVAGNAQSAEGPAGSADGSDGSASVVPDVAFTRLAGDERSAELLVVGAGLGTAADTLWSQVAEMLGDRFEVVGVDLPGHGASPGANAPFTVSDLATAVRSKAHELAGGRPAWYAGVSLAGAVALELATDPGPFSGVATVASATTLGTPEMWAERAELVRNAGTPVMISGSVQRWFAPGFSERSPETVGVMLHDLTDTDDSSYALCCGALAAYDLTGMIARVPVLIAPGEHDGVVSVERAELDAAQLPQSTVQVIHGAAHQPPVENPKQLTEVLVEFIDQHGEAS